MARQQKISLFGQLRPIGADLTAGDRLRALSGISKQVGQIAFNIGARQREKEGRIAGQAVTRDKEGKVIVSELKSEFTIRGQAFNKAAILANRAQIGIDTKEELDRIQNENKLDPEKFKNAALAFKAGTLQGMHEELALIVSLDIDSSVSSRFRILQDDFFKREEAEQKATIEQSIETAVDDILNATRTGDLERQRQLIVEQDIALSEAVEAGLIDPIRVERLKEDIRERIQQQDALRQIDEIVFNEDLSLEQQITKGLSFVKDLRTKETRDLSPEQKDSLLRVIETRVNDVIQRAEMESKNRDLQQEKLISTIKISASLAKSRAKEGISTDLAALVEQTESLHSRGAIPETTRTSILTDIALASDEINRVTLADKRIISRLGGNQSIIMNQKDVDSFYEREIQDDIAQMEPEISAVANANFILKTRTIPSQVKNILSNNILSGDPELIKQASDLIDRIDQVPGLVDLAINANQRSFIDNVNNLSTSMEPEEAIKLANELSDSRDKARTDARAEQIKTEKMSEDYENIVEDAFETFFGQDLLVENVNKEAVEAEFKINFEAFFKAGMSKDRAEEKSIELLKRNWKDSQFGFMKHPPETYYTVGNNSDYIRDQLSVDINQGFIGIDYDKENIFLLSDEITARKAAQGQPDYRVMIIDSNGEIQTLNKRWFPDAKKEQDRQTKENKSKAKTIRKKSTPTIDLDEAAKRLEILRIN